nr:hypothetical protein CFP56_64817 [Quercus suber]
MAANSANIDTSDINQYMCMMNALRRSTPTTNSQDRSDELSSLFPPTARGGHQRGKLWQSVLDGDHDRQLKLEVPSSGIHQVRDLNADVDKQQSTPDSLIEAVMCKLTSSPYEGLDVRMNGLLLQLCEAYRNCKDREALLRRQVDAQLESHHATAVKMQQVQSRWNEERQDYRTEVKRLELLLANDGHGLAEVTLARNDSLLWQWKHKDQSLQIKAAAVNGPHNIFEVLERARHGQDQAYNSQRATFTHRAASPSAHMRCISQQLISKKSRTNVHAELPFGSPPDLSISNLAAATPFESRNNSHKTVGRHAQNSDSYEVVSDSNLSEDNPSNFSDIGGPLF